MTNLTPILRGKTYYVQTRINGRQVWESLKTRDLDKARDAHVLSAALTRIQAKAAAAPAPKTTVTAAPKKAAAVALTIDEVCERYRLHLREREAQQRQEAVSGSTFCHISVANHVRGWHKQLNRRIDETKALAIVKRYTAVEPFYDSLLADNSISLPDRAQCLPRLIKARIAALTELIADDEGLCAPEKATKPLVKSDAPLFSAVVKRYKAERNPSKDTIFDIDVVARDFVAIVGDKPIDTYDRKAKIAWKDVSTVLAPSWNLRKDMKHLDIVSAAKLCRELGLKPKSLPTEERRYGHLKRIFAYAKEHYDGVQNPFDGKMSIAVDKNKVAAANQKDTFGRKRLYMLVNAPELRTRHKKAGDLYYWLTWLSICAGMRLGEILQLRTTHILRKPDRIYLSPELVLKTDIGGGEQCIRSIPIHQKLIQLGFLDYVDSLPKGAPLFHFKRLKDYGVSQDPSKKFGEILTAIGIKKKGLSFHSLRHGFTAEWKRKHPLAVEPRERLLGHILEDGQKGRYGDSYRDEALDMELLKSRADLLRALDFDVDKKPSVSTTQADLFVEG
jgi:integrase